MVRPADQSGTSLRLRGRATIWLALFLGLFLLDVMTALPWALLGEWEHARQVSAPAATLLAGWVLNDLHKERKRRRALDRAWDNGPTTRAPRRSGNSPGPTPGGQS